jgi:hypothetical protein
MPSRYPFSNFRIDNDDENVTLRLDLPGGPTMIEMDANHVDHLIRALAVHRAKVSPEHPAEPPYGEQVALIKYPRFMTEPSPDGESRLGIRHPGFGWLWFQFPKSVAAALAKALQEQVDSPPRSPPTRSN